MSGGAAREYALPQELVERWLADAEQAISEAMDEELQRKKRKLRVLARSYRKLKEENERLRARRGPEGR